MTVKEKVYKYVKAGKFASFGTAAVDLRCSKSAIQSAVNKLLSEGKVRKVRAVTLEAVEGR